MEKILITGITGQDGIFLSKKLLEDNESLHIYGTTRNKHNSFFERLNFLQPKTVNKLSILEVDLQDFNVLNQLIEQIKPTKLINLSGPSSVYQSLGDPNKTIDSINAIFDNLINSFFKANINGVFFQALSSEMFEVNNFGKIDEKVNLKPRSPYAIGKAQIFEKSLEIRDKNGVNICNGILFNHESEFRNDEYLFMKVINSAINISKNKQSELTVGSLELVRDWSYAKDTVEAIYKIIENSYSKDYVVGSGEGHSIKELILTVFDEFNLDFETHVKTDNNLLRIGDPQTIVSNPSKIYNELGWKTTTTFKELIFKCINFKQNISS